MRGGRPHVGFPQVPSSLTRLSAEAERVWEAGARDGPGPPVTRPVAGWGWWVISGAAWASSHGRQLTWRQALCRGPGVQLPECPPSESQRVGVLPIKHHCQGAEPESPT